MVQVQSTWFPLIDRNPQKFVPSIYDGEGRGLRRGDAAGLHVARARPSHDRAASGQVGRVGRVGHS